MIGWVLIGIGVLALVQELWFPPRAMAKTRENVARRGDPARFDAFLGSRRHRVMQRVGLACGVGFVAIGLIVVSGA
jgi:hypothetical protein